MIFSCFYIPGYPNCLSSKKQKEIPYEQTFEHLLAEIKSGADFIITQIVFEANEFLDFVTKCRECGITVPIIPGILPIQVTLHSFTLFSHLFEVYKPRQNIRYWYSVVAGPSPV